MRHLLLTLAVTLTACGGSGGTDNAIKAPANSPNLSDPNGNSPTNGGGGTQAATCSDLALIGEWTKMANAQGALDTTDVLTFNSDCTAHDLYCQVDFLFTPPGTQPEWTQYTSTQGAFTVADTSSRLQTPRCIGYGGGPSPQKACSYVEVDSTHYYIACDFNGLREYVKTN